MTMAQSIKANFIRIWDKEGEESNIQMARSTKVVSKQT
jgi:hypothetical protein